MTCGNIIGKNFRCNKIDGFLYFTFESLRGITDVVVRYRVASPNKHKCLLGSCFRGIVNAGCGGSFFVNK